MNIQEIFDLHDWIEDLEVRLSLFKNMTALNNVLQANLNARNQRSGQPQQIQPFKDQRTAAIEAMRSVKVGQLTNCQKAWLGVHGAMQFLGGDSAETLDQVFVRDASDLASIHQEVQKALNSLNQARSGLKNACGPLKPYFEAVKGKSYPEDAARLSVSFVGEVGIEDLQQFQDRLKEWNQILKCLAIAFDRPANEFRVLGARNGSIVIDLYVYAAAMLPIGYILNRSFNILERLALSVRRIRAIKTLDFSDPDFANIEKAILSEGEKYFSLASKKAANEISKEVLDEIGYPVKRRGEANANLRTAVSKILNHLKRGGELDLHLPHKPEDQDEDETGDDSIIDRTQALIDDFRQGRLDSDLKTTELLELFDFDEEEEDE